MKKTVAMVSLATLTGLSMMAAIEWNTVENLSRGATVIVSSKPEEANRVTDNDNGSRWQAIPSTHRFTNDWALVDLGEVKTFTDVEIIFEASHAKKYSLYISESAIPYESLSGNVNTEDNPLMLDYNKISEEWLAATTPAATDENDTESGYTANHLFADGISGRYILVYADQLNNNGNSYGLSIHELRVANIAGREDVAALKVTDASAKPGASAEVTVTAVNSVGDAVSLDKVSGLKLTANSADVVVAGGENGVFTVSGTTPGSYTLTATAMNGQTEVNGSSTFTVEFDWDGVRNAAEGKSVLARVIPGLDNPNPIENAVDGDMATYYEYNGEWAGGDAWILIDLGSEHYVDAIGCAYGDHSGGIVKFGYSLDNEGIMSFIGDNSQWVWNNDAVPAGWEFKSATRASNAITTVTYEKPVKARYIAVRDVDNPQGKPQVREVLVKGSQIEESHAADMEITFANGGLFVGETTEVSLTILDQYGQPFGSADDAVITVEGGATYADGVITATAKGMVKVTATVGETVKSAGIMVADQADYCMAGAAVTSDECKSAPAAATDGGADPKSHGALYVVTENEPHGEHTHWILADLRKPYDLDMIIAIWEGACPADYDVYVGATEDSLEKLYSVSGHNQNTWYDRFSGKEMKNIQFIKLVTTKNATGYGIKLFDLKAYGTSQVESVATSVEVSVDQDNVATDEMVTVNADVLDQFGAKMADKKAVISVGGKAIEGNTFKATEKGQLTIEAECEGKYDSTTINVVADQAKFDGDAATVTLDGETAPNVIGGQEITFNNGNLPQSVEIDFGREVDFDMIKLRWEAACPADYTIEAKDGQGNSRTVIAFSGRGFLGGFNPVDRVINSAAQAMPGKRAAHQIGSASLNKVNKLVIKPIKAASEWNIRLFGVDAYPSKNWIVTGVEAVEAEQGGKVDVYTLQGVKVRGGVDAAEALEGLPGGLYIVGGRKVAK
ncbi:MAG: discoidin domain-containing protein [[Clostridium] fimetarium]|nr:discoidin domain-containing protein [Alistipes timonensis]MCM1405640.1 discoidin domain-containing protein [[Clostridium] fimetarium]